MTSKHLEIFDLKRERILLELNFVWRNRDAQIEKLFQGSSKGWLTTMAFGEVGQSADYRHVDS